MPRKLACFAYLVFLAYVAWCSSDRLPQTQAQTLFIFYRDKPTKKTNYIISLGSFFGASSNLFCGKITLVSAEEQDLLMI